MRVLAFTRYGREAASTRQRLLQYLPALSAAGIQVDVQPLLGDDYVRSLAGAAAVPKHRIARWYLDRLAQLRHAGEYDLVWVYVELFPFLPRQVDQLIFGSGTPVIVDFDDAFFLSYDQAKRPFVRHLLSGKLGNLLKEASAATCGNAYLRDYASTYCHNSIVVPTVVDTDRYLPASGREKRTPVIGWIGSPSTWTNVQPLLPLIRELTGRSGAVFRAVGAGPAAQADRFDGMQLVDWAEGSEISEVQNFDIGIMPLRDLPFQRGKRGYKLVQYMACGVPLVASPVGVNVELVAGSNCGLLASDETEWRSALHRLLDNPGLRRGMGEQGRRRAVERYSLVSQATRMVDLFRSVAGKR